MTPVPVFRGRSGKIVQAWTKMTPVPVFRGRNEKYVQAWTKMTPVPMFWGRSGKIGQALACPGIRSAAVIVLVLVAEENRHQRACRGYALFVADVKKMTFVAFSAYLCMFLHISKIICKHAHIHAPI
ncbi:MAG: hypothetical protein QM270_11540 [Bacillota bacterium]|nr:hypothetical protein [Bacillota bacterium]